MKKILHLSHTDVNADSRILKEMQVCISESYSVLAIGVLLDEGSKTDAKQFANCIKTMSIYSKTYKILPKIVRHVLALAEILLKFTSLGFKFKPNIIHCHDTVVLPVGLVLRAITGARLIYDAHELESNRNGLRWYERYLTLLFEKLSWRWIDGLIVVSFSINKWYQENIGPKVSAVVLNAPEYKKNFSTSDSYLRNKFGIGKDEKIFIYSGIFEDGRGIDVITKAFSEPTMRHHVVFLGYGPKLQKLKELDTNYENIHVHDSVPHTSVVPIVKSADFGLCLIENVSLSDYYCLPNKLFEYAFANIPVVASKFPDIQRIVNKHDIGVCIDFDIVEFCNAVTVLSKQNRQFKFIELEKLSWAENSNTLAKFYEKILTQTEVGAG